MAILVGTVCALYILSYFIPPGSGGQEMVCHHGLDLLS